MYFEKPRLQELQELPYAKGMILAEILKLSNESTQQIEFIKFCQDMYNRGIKHFKWIHHTPNGGFRDKKTAVKLAREGVKSGVWDIFVPMPRFQKAGLYIEFKWGSSLSDTQKEFHDDLKDYFHFAICRTPKSAKDLVMAYFQSSDYNEFREKLREQGFEEKD